MVYPTTIWNAVFDALAYYGSGSYSIYSRCLSRCCNGMGLEMSSDELITVRSRLFWSFRNSGMLNVSTLGGNTVWTITPPTLVECMGIGFVLQAGSYVANSLLVLLGSSASYHSERIPLWGSLSSERATAHFLVFSKLTKQVLSACAETGVRVVRDAHRELLGHLPSLEDAISDGIVTKGPEVNYREVFTKRFDMESMTWLEFDSQEDLQECLYRIDHPYTESEYVVVHKREDGSLSQAVCREGEWSHLIAAKLFRYQIPISYDGRTKELRMPAGFRLPVLVQRVLFTASMRFPRISGGELVFLSIPHITVQTLCALYPIFWLRSL